MRSRAMRAAVGLAMVLVVALVLGVAVETLGGTSLPRVALTVFTGAVTVLRSGATAAVPGHTGDSLSADDTVSTGHDTKGSITYPDGSITRLDSDTSVVVTTSRDAQGAVHTSFQQPSGLTWNAVQRLVGRSSFKVSGPNQASVEVRGTKFGYYVEHDAAGNPVVWVDAWSGTVQVTGATGSPVLATTGQRVTVRQGAAPTAPVPIPTGDFHLAFTVFNQAIETVTGQPFRFENGTLAVGQTTPDYAVASDGNHDLQFVLGWPGAAAELTVLDPDGRVFGQTTAPAAPVSVVAPHARAGTWKVHVRNVRSEGPEPWWVIVGR